MIDNRPLSPHLSIYKRVLTSIFSIFHRITGIALSFGSILALSIVSIKFVESRQLKLMLPIYLLFVYLTGVHMILIASIRYRFPLEPFLVIIAAFSIYKLLSNYFKNVRQYQN